jgi:hypothetical protein
MRSLKEVLGKCYVFILNGIGFMKLPPQIGHLKFSSRRHSVQTVWPHP